MIRAYATDDPTGYGVRLSIVNQRDDDTHPHEILRIVGNENGVHHFHWTPLIPGVAMEPTLQIPGDHARAVYEALARHFQGTEDTRALPALTGRDT
jgi:hypothetical protein